MKFTRKKIARKKAYDELYLWPIFSKFIRLRDSDKQGVGRCFTCGKPILWTQGDAGHGIPRQHKATKYDEKNSNLQCKPCNGFQGGMREVYKVAMDKKYGEGTWDGLILRSRNISKMAKFEYDLLITHYSDEVAKLKLEKGIQ